jgi:hypothetical protein
MADYIIKYHTEFGYSKIDVLTVQSSKRQSNQNTVKNAKSSDDTIVYKN